MLEAVTYVYLSVFIAPHFQSGGGLLADELLDGTLTFQQKCIALTFDVHIDPMYWVAISQETNIYNWYWVPMVLSQCLGDVLQQYKSVHTYRHDMGALVLTGHLGMAER